MTADSQSPVAAEAGLLQIAEGLKRIADWLHGSANFNQASYDEGPSPASEFDMQLCDAARTLDGYASMLTAPAPTPATMGGGQPPTIAQIAEVEKSLASLKMRMHVHATEF